MDTNEQRELVALYAAWTDAALLTALGPDREQYQPEVVPLLEDEARRRNLPLPEPLAQAGQPPPACPRSIRPLLITVASACFNRFRWTRLTWVGKGYFTILTLMFLPLLGLLLVVGIAALIGVVSGTDVKFSHIELGGDPPVCLIMGTDIGPALDGLHLTMFWILIISMMCGPAILMCYTGFVALAWVWRKCFLRS